MKKEMNLRGVEYNGDAFAMLEVEPRTLSGGGRTDGFGGGEGF